MRLKKLEIYGFKSFAERTEIFFEQGTTGIVGPNGSGKSNISDAVRWVLGEQSAKQLRGAKMEDIIFNGTEKRKPLAWCEVSLMFDNTDGSLAMDCAELEVTRRVYRNGTSEYYLNRAACRLKDITDLFRDTGIGKEGYSLIGQGRIDEILSVKSEDRRNIFEEAVGIVKYKARKMEAERRMENTRQNLVRVEDILQEMETQLGPLEEQSRVARRYLSLQEALRSLELNAFLVQYDRFQARMTEAEALLQGLEGSLQEAEERLAQARARRVSQEEAVQGLEDRARQARQEVLEATRALQALQGENGVLRERILNEQAQAKRLTEDLARAEEKRAANLLAARQQAERGDLDTRALDKARAELEAAERGLEAALGQEAAA
ncbi:MAG TPA: AAA family ATPase, partial [Clostridia bacterium]|nr:AAA family ATPase [Clostridia bacterium]